MTQHTPGPWHVEIRDGVVDGTSYKYVPEACIVSKQTGHNHYVASIRLASVGYSGTQENRNQDEKDAQLISAAPDLLEACQLLAAWDRSNGDIELLSDACSKARAAIAKATQ